MTFPVEIRMDPRAVFPLKSIDGAALMAPDTFAPAVGDRIDADYLSQACGPADAPQISTMNLYVVAVQWRVRIAAAGYQTFNAQPQYELVLRMTISSEPPSEYRARQVHDDTAAPRAARAGRKK